MLNIPKMIGFFYLFLVMMFASGDKLETDNIKGTYAVHKGLHYSNKTSLSWGLNSESDFNVTVSFASQF